MAQATPAPRTTGSLEATLAEMFIEHGMRERRAEIVASRVLIEYPMVRRIGIDAMADRFGAWGLEPAAAVGASQDLLAFELLGRLSYERALGEMSRRLGHAAALGSCLRAAAARRQLRGGSRLEEPGPLGARLVRFALDWLR